MDDLIQLRVRRINGRAADGRYRDNVVGGKAFAEDALSDYGGRAENRHLHFTGSLSSGLPLSSDRALAARPDYEIFCAATSCVHAVGDGGRSPTPSNG
jgi:hypothetical protein